MIALDAVSSASRYAFTSGDLSWSHTCSTGNGLFLVVAVYTHCDGFPYSVAATYAGRDMNQIVQQPRGVVGDWNLFMFTLIHPDVGANTVSLVPSKSVPGASCDFAGGAISYTGVQQAPGFNSADLGNAVGPGTFSFVGPAAEDYGYVIVDAVGVNANQSADPYPLTTQAGQVRRVREQGNPNGSALLYMSDIPVVALPPVSTGWDTGLTWAAAIGAVALQREAPPAEPGGTFVTGSRDQVGLGNPVLWRQ